MISALLLVDSIIDDDQFNMIGICLAKHKLDGVGDKSLVFVMPASGC